MFEVDVASVKKKMKDKAFARSVNRQEILDGAAELGVPLEEHIDFCVAAMQARAEELGLREPLVDGTSMRRMYDVLQTRRREGTGQARWRVVQVHPNRTRLQLLRSKAARLQGLQLSVAYLRNAR